MATLQIRLSASQRDDLAAVCALGSVELDKVVSRLESDNFTIRRSQIGESIKAVVGSDNGVILSRFLFGLAGNFRHTFFSPDVALDKIARSLGETVRTDERFTNWVECRASLRRILETRSVSLSAKALDVSYDFERVYLAGRLLTSIRPIFNEERDEIKGSTIVQTLRLEFISPDGIQSSISIAMDSVDIERLKEECDRAARKATIAKARIEKSCGFEAIIPGDETDE